MPQCNITINIIRSYRLYLKLSAHARLYVNFDFNRRPLAPSGTKFVIHETVNQRNSWSPNGIEGWYIGPAIEHYSCHKCYIPLNAGVQYVLTLDWFPN